jgi:hypothetical protein
MRFVPGLMAILILTGFLAVVGCAQQPAPPPATINEWMKMDQVRP